MRILAIERPVDGIGDDRFTPELAATEARRAWELHQAGTIRELWFRADQATAVLALECEDMAAAEEALATLPLVAAGLIRFEVLPLRAYPGFARLFAKPATPRDPGRAAR
jgi:muconolactone delta-isomerase